MESKISIKDLKDKVQSFCEERDWDQFHNPKDLAIGISTEANELLDLFRFKGEEDMMDMLNDSVKRCSIEEELADTFFFILRFAQRNNMDLAEILYEKMKKNALKYPIEKAKGCNLKYTEYER